MEKLNRASEDLATAIEKPTFRPTLPQDLSDRYPRRFDRDPRRVINDAHTRLCARHGGGMARHQSDTEKYGLQRGDSDDRIAHQLTLFDELARDLFHLLLPSVRRIVLDRIRSRGYAQTARGGA